jgi:lipoate-protein ligase A
VRWRLLLSPPATAAWNMAVDEAVARCVGGGPCAPTLRLYGWAPPAVSIGYFQRLDAEVDREACRALGIGWVRRPTGGRAVLHQSEVTYAFAAPEGRIAGGVREVHRALGEALLEGLRRLGVDAQWAVPDRVHPARASAACFDATSHGEIAVRGRKLVGSAQTRRWGAVLQHGSIPLRLDRDLHARILRPGPGGDAAALRRALEERATCLGEALGGEPEPEAVAAALAEGFAVRFGVTWEEETAPTAAESSLARRLAEAKYGSEAWNADRLAPVDA